MVARNSIAAGNKRRVNGGSSCGGGIQDSACASSQSHGNQWLENLHYIQMSIAECYEIFGHGSFRYAIEAGRIDSLLTQVVLQAQPRRRHLCDRGKFQGRQLRELEVKTAIRADQEERIARDYFTE